MPNLALVDYVVTRNDKDLDIIYKNMKDLQEMEESFIENYYGITWFGNLNLRVNATSASLLKAPAKTASPDDIIYSVEGCRQNITLTGSGYYLRGIFIRRQGTETSKVMVK